MPKQLSTYNISKSEIFSEKGSTLRPNKVSLYGITLDDKYPISKLVGWAMQICHCSYEIFLQGIQIWIQTEVVWKGLAEYSEKHHEPYLFGVKFGKVRGKTSKDACKKKI
jgi:hypothetical protein